MQRRTKLIVSSVCGLLILGAAGCGLDALLRTTASLGGDVAGQRGNAQVLFINNTPFRAVFTFGAYDDFDRKTVPDLRQFSSDSVTLNLEGNTQSNTLQVQCARVFSIGGSGLLARVRENLDEGQFDEVPLVEGVYFSSANLGDDLADAPTEGTAAAVDAFIGPDYECGSLLIYRFEFNDAGGEGAEAFKVDLAVIPAENTRGN